MKQRILALAVAALVIGLSSTSLSAQGASKYHLIIVHSSNNTGQGVVTVDKSDLHPVPLIEDVDRQCASSVCGATYRVGTRVTLTATPAPGSVFMGWSGECSGTAPTCVVRMDRSRDVMVHFGK
jgi:hypothetical protein